jgi:hypothetical protein
VDAIIPEYEQLQPSKTDGKGDQPDNGYAARMSVHYRKISGPTGQPPHDWCNNTHSAQNTSMSEMACSRQLTPSAVIMLLVSDSMTSAQPRFRLHTKHKPELLFAVMQTLAHEDARISFEGRLSHTELAKIAGASLNETEVLKRNTISPRMDFVVLPLTSETVPEIEKAIVSKVAFKDYAGIVHVQIERQGRLAFVACDHFHEDCVWVSEAVPDTFLAELVKNRVLYSYARA